MALYSLQASSILVLRPGALGDTVLALPAIRALRRAAGRSAVLEVVGYKAWLELALNALHADRAHSIDLPLFAGLYGPAFGEEIRRFLARFSLVVAWCYDRDGWLGSLLQDAGVRHIRADPYPAEGERTHATDHLLGTLEELGIDAPRGSAPELVISAEARRAAQEILAGADLLGRPFLALHPGSGSPAKNWPPPCFASVAAKARAAGLGVLLIRGEADQEPVEAVVDRLDRRPPVAEGLPVKTLAALLGFAAAYLGNDSGVTHLAAATGTPTLALFGPTDPGRWGPRGPQVLILAGPKAEASVWTALEAMVFPPSL
jgi:heptosyltransferase-3